MNFAAKIAVALWLKNKDITGLQTFCFLAPSMPGFRPFIPEEFNGCPLVTKECTGTLAEQRQGLAQLLSETGWSAPTKEDNGRPRMGHQFCSLSHGGGWVAAVRGDRPVGIDVEGATARLDRARKKFVGSADQPVLDRFEDNLDTLCRLWTAKEAVFKAFGTGVDFLTGIEWTKVSAEGACVLATAQGVSLELRWVPLPSEAGTTWLAIAAEMPGRPK